jgi:YHS domain-containing protein
LGAFAAGLSAAEQPIEPALSGNDPVELSGGSEVAGLPAFTLERGGYRYQFASEANLRRFEGEPARYEIRFGGACMRMGPVSGAGSPDRWFVHEGAIYLFASDACRNTFKADPARFIDRADDPPQGTDDDVKRARVLLERVIDALGGKARVAGLERLERHYQLTYVGEGDTTQVERTRVIEFPDTYRLEDDYGEYKDGWSLRGSEGFLAWKADRPVAESVRGYMVRQFHRDPIVILKAWQRGEALAVAAGSGSVAGRTVDFVLVAAAGATTRFAIDRQTHHVIETSHRGRGQSGIGEVVKRYDSFLDRDGVTFAFEEKTSFDGVPLENPRVMLLDVLTSSSAR